MKLGSYLRVLMVLMLASMLAAIFVLAPRADVAFAGLEDPGITFNVKGTLKNKMNTEFAQKIRFGYGSPFEWRVVGADSDGAVPQDGAITLISVRDDDYRAKWAEFDSIPFDYGDSNVRSTICGIVDVFSDVEKGAMVKRGDLSDDLMWLFSRDEAEEIDETLRKTDENLPEDPRCMWWLRDTTYYDYDICRALVVNGDGTFDDTGYSVCYEPEGMRVRPGFHLDESKVLFMSGAYDCKETGDEGADALAAVGPNIDGDWKLTLKDDARGDFDAKVYDTEPVTYSWVEVDYSSAVTGDDEYLSALIMDEDGNVTYYGRIKALKHEYDESGRVRINLQGKRKSGESLYVFNEHYSGNIDTDWSSALKKMIIEVGPIDARPASATIKVSPKTVRKGKKTTVKVTSNSGAKLTAKASNSKAKKALKKKYVKIKAGKTAKITFTKKAPKGKYTFKVTSPAKGKFKKTVKIITIKVK